MMAGCDSILREGKMRFEVVRYESPHIFVIDRQTFETYRFAVDADDMLVHDGLRRELGEARRTALAFLAQNHRAAA
jgi:hypothetical protein